MSFRTDSTNNAARHEPLIEAGLDRVAWLSSTAGRSQLALAATPSRSIAVHARFVRDVIDLLTGAALSVPAQAERHAA